MALDYQSALSCANCIAGVGCGGGSAYMALKHGRTYSMRTEKG